MDRSLILAWIMVLCTAMAPACCQGYYSHSVPYVPAPEKVTHLHFFLHDTLSGKNPSAVMVARPNMTNALSVKNSSFGLVFSTDDPLTVGPNVTSEVIGNAQGLWVSTGQDVFCLVVYLDFGFTQGKFNGSSISMFSRNPISQTERELAVVGGRGKFRMAKGFAHLKTFYANFTSGDAIVDQYYFKTVPYVPKEKKVTNLHFFFHGTIGGENPTAVTVARANNSSPSPSNSLVVDDAPLTFGPEPTSEAIGNAQGLEVFAGRDTTTVVVYLDFGFTEGHLNGSSISIFSRNPATEKERELVVIGGRGKFRMAEGVALLKTYHLDKISHC
ncbi:hypothetical protein REPUB_Repub01dG0226400 [Reevesia pubescens]